MADKMLCQRPTTKETKNPSMKVSGMFVSNLLSRYLTTASNHLYNRSIRLKCFDPSPIYPNKYTAVRDKKHSLLLRAVQSVSIYAGDDEKEHGPNKKL